MAQRQLQVDRFKVWLNSFPTNGSYRIQKLLQEEFEVAPSHISEERFVAVGYQVPAANYTKSHSVLLGAEFQPATSAYLNIEIAVGYREVDRGLTKSTAQAICNALKLSYQLEPSFINALGSGVLRFNRLVCPPHEDKAIIVNLAFYILRLLTQTTYNTFTDTQLIDWMLSTPFPLKSAERIEVYLPRLYDVLAGDDGDLAALAMELISISANASSIPEIEKALEKVILKAWSDSQRVGVHRNALSALRRIDTSLSRDLAKSWMQREIFKK